MIIGEARVNENNYYDESHQQQTSQQQPTSSTTTQYEVLKRKLSGGGGNESEVECKSLNEKNNSKMQFIENIITENYHTFQTDQIHQDGDQSYINLTVLTPSMVHYDKNAITIHPPTSSNDQQQNFIIHQQNDHHVMKQQHVTTTSTRHYQHHQQPGKLIKIMCDKR